MEWYSLNAFSRASRASYADCSIVTFEFNDVVYLCVICVNSFSCEHFGVCCVSRTEKVNGKNLIIYQANIKFIEQSTLI
jgi:hypothetical protein